MPLSTGVPSNGWPIGRSPASSNKRPRFYVLQVLHNGDPPLVSVIRGPYTDLMAAWQEAGLLRTQQPQAMFIAGEMLSATT